MSENQDLISQMEQERFTNPKRVIELSKQLIQRASKKEDHQSIILGHFFKGDANLTLGNVVEAVEEFVETLTLQKKWKIDIYQEKTYNNLAICFDLQGDYLLSLEYFFEGLKTAIKNKDVNMQSVIYSNMGCIFLKYGDVKSAQKFFKKVKYEEDDQESDSAFFYHIRMAQVYARQGKLKELKKEYEACSKCKLHREHAADLLLSYLQLAIADMENRQEEFEQILEDVIAMGNRECSLEDWDDWIEIWNLAKRKVGFEKVEELFQVIQRIADDTQIKEKKSVLIMNWISYLEEMGEEEKRKEYVRLFYELDLETSKNRQNNQILQMNNRLLLNQKLEEQNLMLQKKQALSESSKKDPLTDLFNRYTMIDFMGKMMKRGVEENQTLSCGLIEIRDFKNINDSYGYVVGDMCLKYVAEAIKKNETEELISAHMRGNEFMLISLDCAKEKMAEILEQIKNSLRIPLFVNGVSIPVQVNYGFIAKIPTKTDTIYDIFHLANDALYEQ